MPQFSGRVVVSALLWSSLVASAADDQVSRIRDTLRTTFPDIQVRDVLPSQNLPGFYEVVTPTELAYVSADGERLILGSVLDVGSKRNLTAERWNDLNRIDFNALPLDKAIEIRKGNSERKLALFADPLCPYCQELEHTLAALDNITVYVLPFPLENVHPGAMVMARNIWCAKDQAAVWTHWMLDKIKPSECTDQQAQQQMDEHIRQVVEHGDRMNVNVTPTLFLPDGQRISGLVSKERLEQELDRQSTSPK